MFLEVSAVPLTESQNSNKMRGPGILSRKIKESLLKISTKEVDWATH